MKLGLGAKIGIAIGLLGGLIGMSVGIWVAPAQGMAMAAIFVGVFGIVFFIVIRPMMRNSKLQKTGVPAQARVLSVSDTGVSINNNPQVKLELEVLSADGGDSYQAEARALVSRINPMMYAPGAVIDVRVDRDDPKRVAVAEAQQPRQAQTQEELMGAMMRQRLNSLTPQEKIQRQKMLAEITAFNKHLLMSGQRAQGTVLSKEMVAVLIDGDTMLITLNLMVSPFTAQATVPVSRLQAEHYNPGLGVQVAFDPANTTRVAVDSFA